MQTARRFRRGQERWLLSVSKTVSQILPSIRSIETDRLRPLPAPLRHLLCRYSWPNRQLCPHREAISLQLKQPSFLFAAPAGEWHPAEVI